MVEIEPHLSIPDEEIRMSAARSSGPGGQHVNKASTKVILRFDVRNSPSLSDVQRARILERLATRVTKGGVLVLRCQKHRSQSANREELLDRFAVLLRDALRPRRARKKTKPGRAARERRLERKRERGRLKEERSRRFDADD